MVSKLNIKIKSKSFPIKIKEGKEEKNIIFKDLNIEIEKGQFLCIFGPSGCGKTTLLNLIASLDKNFDGLIESNNESHKKESEIKLSYVFQSNRLFPWLTALENISFPIQYKKNHKVIAAKMLNKMELNKYKNSFANRLSGGMQKRISLARAFVSDPDVLLLDEPFISLDKEIADKLRKVLIQLWKKTKPTIVFVTHNLDEALQLADRIIFLSRLPSKILLDYKVRLARPRNIKSKKFASLKRLLSSSTRTNSK